MSYAQESETHYGAQGPALHHVLLLSAPALACVREVPKCGGRDLARGAREIGFCVGRVRDHARARSFAD